MNQFKDFFGHTKIIPNKEQSEILSSLNNEYDKNYKKYDKHPKKFRSLENKKYLEVLKIECKKFNKPIDEKFLKTLVFID